jgi:hypothetical protein
VPFLRVIRDKRGYETTYLMDWYVESGRQRSRVLYAFRGPGGVRVGRVPLEPGTMHELEARHPDVSFDWRAIFADRQVIESAPDLRRRRPRRDEPAAAEPAGPPIKPQARAQTPPPSQHQPIPATIQGETLEDQLMFLSEWYGKVKERITHRTAADPARREALLILAERLNPAAWDGAADFAEPLGQAAEALERLGRVLTRRRRRSGKRRGGPADGATVAEAGGDSDTADAMDDENDSSEEEG